MALGGIRGLAVETQRWCVKAAELGNAVRMKKLVVKDVECETLELEILDRRDSGPSKAPRHVAKCRVPKDLSKVSGL